MRRTTSLAAALLTLTLATPSFAQHQGEDAQESLVLPTAHFRFSMADRRVEALHVSPHSPNVFLGATYYPGAQRWFATGGVELDIFERMDGYKSTYVMPVARLGWSWSDPIGDPMDVSVLAEPLARVHLYGMASWRPASDHRDPMLRFGIGYQSFSLMMASIFHIPGNMELVFEADRRRVRTVSFRLGWGF